MATSRKNTPTPRQPMSRDERRHVVSLQKHKARRRKKIISLVLLALLIAFVGVVLSLTVFFHITEIEVENSSYYNESEIIEAGKIELQDNMFLADVKQAAENIQTTLPYIEQVSIKRSLTGKMTYTVTETRAAMAFFDNGEYIILSPTGKVLERSLIISEHVCVIEGVEFSEALEGYTVELADMMSADGSTVLRDKDKLLEDLVTAYDGNEKYLNRNITQIDLSDINNLQMIYQYRILLKCGDVSKLDQTLKFAGAIIERLDGENPNYKGTVDLTIENKAYYNEGDIDTTAPVTEAVTEAPTDENGETVMTADEVEKATDTDEN